MSFPNVPLGICAQVIGGFAFQSEDFSEKGISIIRISDIQDGSVSFCHSAKIPFEKAKNGLEFRIEPEDILIAMSGATTGKIGTVPKDIQGLCLQNQRVGNFRIIEPNKIIKRYLRYCLTSSNFQKQIWNLMAGAAQPNISSKQLESIKIPLPPIDEQKRIAKILDKADSLRAKRRAALAQLNTLTQSIFLEMFGDPAKNTKGWPIRRIGDLLTSASYGTSEKAGSSGEFPVLRMNNLTPSGEMDLTDLKYMDLGIKQRERYLIKSGDVLFNRTNSPDLVGKTAIFRYSKKMAYAGYLIRLRVNEQNHPEYLSAFLNTTYSKRVLRGMCKSIIGMANINATEIQTVRIPQPPLSLQHKFARRVSAIEKLKAAHKTSLNKMDELFASVQYRAFKGEL